MTQALEIIIPDDRIPRIDSRLVAQSLGIEHKHFLETVRTYQTDFEDLGIMPFETAKMGGRGRPETFVLLNEDQAIFAATLSRNTRQVVEFKLKLTKAFAEARKQLEAGHAQPMAAPRLNRLWEQRLLLFNRKTRIPAGYWCIFNEIAHICWDLEEFRGIQVHERAAPDISVALLWMQEVRRLGLDESLIRRYPHHYPDQRGIQYANIYPNAWLGTFRTWLERQYLPHEFQAYLKTHAVTPTAAVPQVPEKTVKPSHTNERKG